MVMTGRTRSDPRVLRNPRQKDKASFTFFLVPAVPAGLLYTVDLHPTCWAQILGYIPCVRVYGTADFQLMYSFKYWDYCPKQTSVQIITAAHVFSPNTNDKCPCNI
jgi:hypothetical protein